MKSGDSRPEDSEPAKEHARSRPPRLFDPEHRLTVVVLASGVALFATNTYITTTLLPTAVIEIGGQRFYAWTMTVFLLAALVASSLVSRTMQRFGTRGPYAFGFFAFALGSLLCTLAPTMTLLLVGRGAQGLAGGLLMGMAYSLVNTALPEPLWRKAFGLLSAMWGIGNVVGPVVGGLFAQWDFWRGAFGLLVLAAVVLGLVAFAKIPDTRITGHIAKLPVLSLVLLFLAISVVSMSSFTSSLVTSGLILLGGLIGVGVFVLVDRRTASSLLPKETYRAKSSLPWVYLAIATLCIASTNETFIPLFGQMIAHMGPLLAGLLGVVYSWGWSVASMSFSGVDRQRRVDFMRVLGPSLTTVCSIAYGLLNLVPVTPGIQVAWFIILFIGGAGVGMAFPTNATAAMRSTKDPAESAAAAAGVNTVQMMANAFGAALSGWAVGLVGSDYAAQAWSMSLILGIVAGFGVLFVIIAIRRAGQSASP